MALLDMGTNFYWKHDQDDKSLHDEFIHIGKRSAAGPWCFKCGVTACIEGTAYVHSGDATWYETCPVCGKNFSRTTCSFTWTMFYHEHVLRNLIEQGIKNKVIIDDNGVEYTPKQFKKVVDDCKIIQQSSGEWC